MKPEIRPGVLRDICFVASNLRDEDKREVFASARLQSGTEAGAISFLSSPGWCWTAWLDGQPVAAFGVGLGNPVHQPHIRHAWAFGTSRFKRAAPAITRFCVENWPKRLIAEGVTRVEIRSIADHDIAHRWLSGLRAHRECEMPNYGAGGETFTLWSWRAEDWKD
ncbi:hypothetical protein [Aquamicrobium defluvii]|uniref:hypothetical protein n=1 Tax=Aquamicrobium defluvii TaxID=69279 RepID=UPI00105C6447|nr:hypothetical protein [Aquamicrobium defluvii]